MKFTPMTNEQLQVSQLLKEGEYRYQVIKSEDRVSQAGNEYTSITLKVWDNEGKENQVFTNMALIKLLKHFCDVNEMEEDYKSGDISSDKFMYKNNGRVVIGIEGEKPNPNGGTYRAKNIVKDYIKSYETSSINKNKDENMLNDDLPF